LIFSSSRADRPDFAAASFIAATLDDRWIHDPMVLHFAGFELDRQRAELRRPDGEAIKLRPKSFSMLVLFAANAGRVLSKQELMDTVWPNVHVGDDSVFQCIKEIRTALGDDRRQLIKLVSGRGYLFDAEVSAEQTSTIPPGRLPVAGPAAEIGGPAEPTTPQRLFGLRRPIALAVVGLGAILGLVIVATAFAPGTIVGHGFPTVTMMPISVTGGDAAAMATNVTTRLTDGLAKIDNVHVAAPQAPGRTQADFVVNADLQKNEHSWDARARMSRTATGEVVWTTSVSVAADESDLSLQQSRLAAGIGHALALRISALLESDARLATSDGKSALGAAKASIEQATASIMQTSRERFAVAQTMLEKALSEDPDNSDLAVALSNLQMRGVQMVWYKPDESIAAQASARSILERAVRNKPGSIPVLEAYCRFLNATNEFVESLVACARALNFDPWNGVALYHIGLAQMQLGRFDDALATFKQADRFDTPQVSRWTWQLGVGMMYVLMDRSEDALPWLKSSIAITPASGRPYMLLSATYQRLGRTDEAKVAMNKGLALRPGSTADNVALPRKNASPTFLAAMEWIREANIAAGLPEH
jgi:DNA-binding winged helix-turn-helix (wHTH) protein/tetratricopeptide (TPR) repeat protein